MHLLSDLLLLSLCDQQSIKGILVKPGQALNRYAVLSLDGQLSKSFALELLASFTSIKLKVRSVERAFDRKLPEADHTHDKALLPVFQVWEQCGWRLFRRDRMGSGSIACLLPARWRPRW